jgi:hypothetical protein
MACCSGAFQRAHILFIEPNGRRNQSRHTLTIQRGYRKGNASLVDSLSTIVRAADGTSGA